MTTETTHPGFLVTTAEWMASRGRPVQRVISVEASGTDWAGSTESGFYSTFEVMVEYVDPMGTHRTEIVEGSDMESMWRFIVMGWRP